MMKHLSLILIFTLLTLPSLCTADEIYTFVVKKQEEKRGYDFWLSDWLQKRDRIRLMDLWLALHTPTPYEFFLGGATVFGNVEGGNSFTGSDLHFAAFNRIFGLELHRDSSIQKSYTGTFDFRFFGFYDQGTNMTAQVGIRSFDLGVGSTRNAVLGLRTDLFIARGLGLHGLYRHFYASTPNEMTTLPMDRWEGGAFLDFSFLRLYGNYFTESYVMTHKGFELGARVYF